MLVFLVGCVSSGWGVWFICVIVRGVCFVLFDSGSWR